MRIIIDMQGLQSKASGGRGVGRYTQSLVKRILTNNTKYEIYLAINGAMHESIDFIRKEFSCYIDDNHFIVWQNFIDTSAEKSPDIKLVKAAKIIKEAFFASYKPHLIFSTNLQEGFIEPAVTSVKEIDCNSTLYCTTLHDLVPYHYKEQYLSNPIVSEWYYEKINYIKKSDIIITDSYASKEDIKKFIDIDPSKIFVIELGFDENVFNSNAISAIDKKNVLLKYDINKPFIFYVGGNDPHKNIERLIRAYASDKLLNEEICLVIGGGHFLNDYNIKQLINELNLKGKIVTPGFVDELDLPLLYKSCACFVFPSTHEGFGLPALEAMACGIPVVGSKDSSIGEVINNNAALFNPYDINEISLILNKAVFDSTFAQSLIDKGKKRASNYSWDKSALKLLNIFDVFIENVNKKQKTNFSNPLQDAIQLIAKLNIGESDDGLIEIAKSLSETFDSDRKSRLYLDLSAVVIKDYKSGIQRVARAISSELLKLKLLNYDIVIVYTQGDGKFYKSNRLMRSLDLNNEAEDDIQIDFNKTDILLYLDLHPQIAILNMGMTRHLRSIGVKVYHVVYDILPLLKPETFWPELCCEFVLWAETVSSSDGAICISKSVASELGDYLKKYGTRRASKFNIGWFHLGADIENSLPSVGGIDENALALLQKIQFSQTFLMVGTIEPRKGHQQTLQAFELLWQKNLNITLVIVGRLGWGMHEFKTKLCAHVEFKNRLFWLEGISDEYLEKLYHSSKCLIASSEGEGFGLPLIEAAQKNIPIIARDIPVFREVIGNHGFYFGNTKSSEILAKAVEDWISLYELNRHPLSSEMPYLTWKQSAAQLLKIIIENDFQSKIECKGSMQLGILRDFRSSRLKFTGFSYPETEFRWTDGNEAEIAFYLSEVPSDADVCISCMPFGLQHISISLNDQMCFDNIINEESYIVFNATSCEIGINKIKFRLPNARSPNDSDTRLIALAFRDIEIIETNFPVVASEIYNYSNLRLRFRGFSGSEDGFKWSDSKISTIGFNWARNTAAATIRIKCNIFEKQNIAIELNSEPVFDGLLEGDNSFSFEVKSLRFGFNILKFKFPDAQQPSESDTRTLALAFRELVIEDQ